MPDRGTAEGRSDRQPGAEVCQPEVRLTRHNLGKRFWGGGMTAVLVQAFMRASSTSRGGM